jgi:GNAT superfamily N-acetyltransferase
MAVLRELTDDRDWERATPILRQLWDDRDEAELRSWRAEEDYRLLGWFVEPSGVLCDGAVPGPDRLVAVAGVYVRTVLHHERTLWVHDLVVEEAHRGDGHGAAFLDAIEAWGEHRGCDHLALACAADNDRAASFYDSAGMDAFGTVYETDL